MKLRDEFSSPEELCRRLDIDQDCFDAYIAERNISYAPESGRFVID